jgi:signal transduction histidine kinase
VNISLEEHKKDYIKIIITDTGVGIPPEDMDKIFQKFFRGSNVVRLEPNGSGLGLYITKNIIKQHGGDISVDSELGRGTKFSVVLPIVK